MKCYSCLSPARCDWKQSPCHALGERLGCKERLIQLKDTGAGFQFSRHEEHRSAGNIIPYKKALCQRDTTSTATGYRHLSWYRRLPSEHNGSSAKQPDTPRDVSGNQRKRADKVGMRIIKWTLNIDQSRFHDQSAALLYLQLFFFLSSCPQRCHINKCTSAIQLVPSSRETHRYSETSRLRFETPFSKK